MEEEEEKEDTVDDVLALKRDISTHSLLSSSSGKISERKMNLKNKPFSFSEEDTTFKPPKRGAGAGGGKGTI